MEQILSVLYAVLGLQLVIVAFLFAVAWMLDGKPTLTNILPKINNYARRGVYELGVRLQKPKKIKNLGQTPVTPDVDGIILRKFVRVLLQEIGQSVDIEAVKLTEPVWVAGGKFKELIGGSPAQFRACMDRLEAERVVTRAGGKNVRVWAMPYRSIASKLQRLLK